MVKKYDLDTVIGILFKAKIHYKLWEELEKRRDQKNIDLINSGYATFIEYTRQAHFKALIVELHKLVETRNDTYNLKMIVDQYVGALPSTDAAKEELEKYKNAVDVARKGIFVLRNDLEAHQSSSKTAEQIFKTANVSSQEIESFILETGRILNMINSKCFKEQQPLNDIGETEAVEKLFSAMAEYEST